MHEPNPSSDNMSARDRIGAIILAGTAIWMGLILLFHAFGFSFDVSDEKHYLEWSHDLLAGSGQPHPPGYSITIAFCRLITFGLVPGVLLMQFICYAAWLAGLHATYRILEALAPETAVIGVLLFAFYPFVGICYVSYPRVDALTHALMLYSLLFAIQRAWWAYTIAIAGGLLTHLALAPFALGLSLVCMFTRGLSAVKILLSGVPLILYYLIAAWKENDIFWFFQLRYDNLAGYGDIAKSKAKLPLLDGVLTPFTSGNLFVIGKSCLLLMVLVASLLLLFYFARRRNWLMFSMVGPVAFYAIVMNQHSSWVIFRFGIFLVVPFCVWLLAKPHLRRVLDLRSTMILLIVCLAATQVFYLFYMVRSFPFNSLPSWV